MATFSQWWVSQRKNPSPRQITYVCGSERVLVEDVVETIRVQLNVSAVNYASFFAGVESERQIWAALDQHPMGRENRLVVIRHADQLQQMDRLIEWVKHRTMNPSTYVILVSSLLALPRLEPERLGAKGDLPPWLTAFTGKGYVIECKPYTRDSAKHAVAWVQSKVKMRDGLAGHLLNRANGDLRLVKDVLTKLSVFPEDITLNTINGMLTERPRDTFIDALLALDKRTALMAMRDIGPDEYSRTLGLLDSQLDLAGMVHDMQVEHRSQAEIARAAGNKNFLVKDLMSVAQHYDARRRQAIRTILSLADEALRGGNTKGVLEVVVAFW